MTHHTPVVVGALVLALAACSGGGDETLPSTTATPTTAVATSTTTSSTSSTTTVSTTSTTTTTTTTIPPIPRQPLTGEVLADGTPPIDRPALAIKIDNASPARRNHRGLGLADIVFEEIVEGDITRFAAVFHSRDAETVGPIRSGRSQDVDLLTSFASPLFAWSGGNPGVERLIAGSTLTDLNWQRGGKGYYRGPGSIPHNLYNSTARLWEQTPPDHPGSPPPVQFTYVRPDQIFDGRDVLGFELAMAGIDVEWTWDAERQQYLRSQERRPHDDADLGRIGATNVIVMAVEYRPSQIDARSPEAQTIGEGGPLWVFSSGRVREGRWVRPRPEDPIRLDLDGRQIGLNPGTTWIELARAEPTDDPANPTIPLAIQYAE